MKDKPFDPIEFRSKFRAFFASLSFMSIMALIFCAVFFEPVDKDLLKPIISFLLGSLLTVVITFYFDGNENQGGAIPPVNVKPEKPTNNQDIPEIEKKIDDNVK